MTDVDSKVLLEIAERQKAIQDELAGSASAYAEALEKYEKSDNAYREQLERYGKEQEDRAVSGKVAIALRLLGVFLLVYIAYRVSP